MIGEQNPWIRLLQQYGRMAWLALVVFVMVGSCTEQHELTAICTQVVAVMWVIVRIMAEGIEAVISTLHRDESDPR